MPASPVTAPATGRRARRSARIAGSASHRKRAELEEQLQQLRRGATWSVLGLVLVCLLTGAIAFGETRKHRELLGARLAERNELREVQASLAEAEGQIDSLVRGRIPGLRPVAFDEVIALGTRYVRNLVLTLVRTVEGVSYEYKFVLQNDSDVMVLPNFAIHFFDHLGVEIGRATVASPGLDSSAKLALYPGEVRSYAAAVELPPDRLPAYFRLQFH